MTSIGIFLDVDLLLAMHDAATAKCVCNIRNQTTYAQAHTHTSSPPPSYRYVSGLHGTTPLEARGAHHAENAFEIELRHT